LLYWVFKYLAFAPLCRLLFRPSVSGAENIPKSGGAMLVSNHISAGDTYLLPSMIRRRMTFPAKIELFRGKGVGGRFMTWFLKSVGQVPIDRSGGRASASSMEGVLHVLRSGNLLGIYPEGTRSPDGRLYRGKTGVARMALEAKVPVIPVAMIGTEKVNPIGSKIWRPGRIKMVIGRPLDFSRYEGMAGDRFVERSMTDEIMYRLMELSGQQYVDVYAAKVKEDLAAAEGGPAAVSPPAHQEGRGPGTVTRLPGTKAG
jgi:1-acyl-sn-glycerol-3-phosphate acyltransferase